MFDDDDNHILKDWFSGDESKKEDFLENCKYGLIAVDETGHIIHFTSYLDYPSDIEVRQLMLELYTDEQFGLVGRTDYKILDCPQGLFDMIISEAKKKVITPKGTLH